MEKKIIYAEVHHQVENEIYITDDVKLAKGQAIFVKQGTSDYNKLYINLEDNTKPATEAKSFVLLTEENLEGLGGGGSIAPTEAQLVVDDNGDATFQFIGNTEINEINRALDESIAKQEELIGDE